MISRRTLLTAAAATVAGAAYPVAIESQWLEVSSRSVRVPIQNAVRILHLSDLHASWAVPMSLIERAVSLGLAANPDLICLTGDFITHRFDFEFDPYVRVLQRLSAARPTFAIVGNHDGGNWAKEHRGFADHSVVDKLLDQAGVALLHNRSERVRVNETELHLVGVGDIWGGELDANEAFREVQRRGPVVLLSHNPDSKQDLLPYDWDLMLSGHTHGGQVMIPFEGPRYAPVQDKRFVQGLQTWNGRQLYISRGVGSIGSVRFRCRPEVSILELEPTLAPS